MYRKPVGYIPPYNYCDRWCDRCRIDKSRCLLYQTEMDDRLHREIDGLGEPTPEEMVDRMMKDARAALRMVEEQVRELGLDPEEIRREAAARPEPPRPIDPIVEEATALARALSAFLRVRGGEHPGEAEVLRHSLAIVAPKLGRATMKPLDESGEADAILQAQVADRTLASMVEALEAIRRREPHLADEMLDLLSMMKVMRGEIRERWLDRPCDLLEPAAGAEWWGPLRDITPTLKHFRR